MSKKRKYLCWSDLDGPTPMTEEEIVAKAIALGVRPGPSQESHGGMHKAFYAWYGKGPCSVLCVSYPPTPAWGGASRMKVSGLYYPTAKRIDKAIKRDGGGLT